jgi:hypothetical protein
MGFGNVDSLADAPGDYVSTPRVQTQLIQ